jgi:hypothetical protein
VNFTIVRMLSLYSFPLSSTLEGANVSTSKQSTLVSKGDSSPI